MGNNRMGLGAFFAMLILILDSKTALLGAQEGLQLCITTVIPSLFPFILLSIALTRGLQSISLPKRLSSWLGLPKGTESILICAFLGGYPVGARAAAESYREGRMTKAQAEAALGWCSNAGPAFLFGMGTSLFSSMWMPWALWAVHILSAFLAGIMTPSAPVEKAASHQGDVRKAPQLMAAATSTMGTICGWVILFRVLLTFLQRWFLWLLPVSLQVLLSGFLELSNGCCELARIGDESTRFLLCSVMLAFGGICVTMQTVSVTEGLSLRFYLRGKGLQTLFSLLFALMILHPAIALWCAPVLVFPILMAKSKNSSSIPQPSGV